MLQIIGKPKLLGWVDGLPKLRIRYRWRGGKIKQVTRVLRVRLLTNGESSSKMRKNPTRTLGLSLLPSTAGNLGDLCGNASDGCRNACLNGTGMAAVWESVQLGRAFRTAAFQLCRKWFIAKLEAEIRQEADKAEDDGVELAIRLNVFSDIAWHLLAPQLFDSRVNFYDYSKFPSRVGAVLPNYWITFSKSEDNDSDVMRLLGNAKNATVVFAGDLPKTWRGYRVIDGDANDERFNDPRGRKHGVVVGLKLKYANNHQKSQAIESGFAV